MLQPDFYAHLLDQGAEMDILFCHRWLLLSFKREFFNEEVLKMWEACWSRYQTDYFHIFLCVAMVQEYGKAVVEQNMPADDMLQFFTDLSMKMDGTKVLRLARQLLLKFRQLPSIPVHCVGCCLGQESGTVHHYPRFGAAATIGACTCMVKYKTKMRRNLWELSRGSENRL